MVSLPFSPDVAFSSDVVIGLEIHVELKTKTKLFCGCARSGRKMQGTIQSNSQNNIPHENNIQSEIPNIRACPICLGHPGSRPVLNKKALDFAIKIATALGCIISDTLLFSRKAYFYPDMSKNFQITQFEEPLGSGGSIKLRSGKIINLQRLHLEEDPASIVYPEGMSMTTAPFTYLDYNRAGNPLVEIVTLPKMESPAEARDFLNQLTSILTYLSVFDVNECIIKADANVSVKESNYTRVEIKNISGFKELESALTYEITRQRALLRRGLAIKRETRGWNDASKTTVFQRSKEGEADYGYITESDLSEISVTEEMIALLKKEIPELAHQKIERYIRELKLDAGDAEVLAMELELAELFEKVAREINPILAARWLRRELLRVLNYNKKTLREIEFDEKELIELLVLVEEKAISEKTAQKLMEKLMETRFSPREHVQKEGLLLITSEGQLTEISKRVLAANSQAVNDYINGNEKAFHFLVGQVMKETKGKAEPELVNRVMKRALRELDNPQSNKYGV